MQLFSNKSVDDVSSPFFYEGYRAAGHLNVYVEWDLGGGTVTLEAKSPNNQYVTVAGQGMTEEGMFILESAPAKIRARLSGSNGASVNVWVESDSLVNKYVVVDR